MIAIRTSGTGWRLDMAADLVTVFGGTGFLGREIVSRLAAQGTSVRIAARNPNRIRGDEPGERVSTVRADVCDDTSVAAAVAGAGSVINAVGLYVERGVETFDAVHIAGAARVARLAARAGVRRLVHVSGIGASVGSASRYVRARAEGERRVREHFEGATIVRPSVLFGPGDSLLASIDAITRAAPVFPLFGRGLTRLQPVYVGDVADALVRVLALPETGGRICELGGPDIFTYRELIDAVLNYRGRRRWLLPIPYSIWTVLAHLLSVLPSPPLTVDQVILMRDDNVVGGGVVTLADLVPTPHSLQPLIASCLARPESG